MGLKEAPTVTSPFSQKDLYFVVDGGGNIFVDYTPDLYDVLQGHDGDINPGDDIRELLVQNSEFVPAYSLPYTIDKKQIIQNFFQNSHNPSSTKYIVGEGLFLYFYFILLLK